MNRKVLAVLVGTFLALVAATVWVPVRRTWQTPPGDPYPVTLHLHADTYGVAWSLGRREATYDEMRRVCLFPWKREYRATIENQPRWAPLALTHGLILAIGGLLALGLRTRERRREA